MVAGYMACPSWSIRQNAARYRRLSRSMLKQCFAKVRADEVSGHQLVSCLADIGGSIYHMYW